MGLFLQGVVYFWQITADQPDKQIIHGEMGADVFASSFRMSVMMNYECAIASRVGISSKEWSTNIFIMKIREIGRANGVARTSRIGFYSRLSYLPSGMCFVCYRVTSFYSAYLIFLCYLKKNSCFVFIAWQKLGKKPIFLKFIYIYKINR